MKKKLSLVFLGFLIVLLVLPTISNVYASPAHTFDTKYQGARALTNPYTFSYTCGSGTTLFVLSIVVGGTTARAGGAPTYNGVPLTQADQNRQSTETFAELWYLLNPSTGSAYQVSIPNTGGKYLSPVASSYKAATGYISALRTANGGTGTSTNPTGPTLTGLASGDVIVAVVGTGATTWAPTARTGVQLYDRDDGTYGNGAQYLIKTDGNNVAMGWTFATSDDWAICEAAFKEVLAPQEYSRSASQSITVASSTSTVEAYLKAVSQGIAVGLTTATVEEYLKSASQAIGIAISSGRVSEFFRAVSQAIGIGLQAIGITIGEYVRDAFLTIVTTLTTTRIADFIRTATQGISFNLVTSRIADFTRAVTQAIATSLTANRLIDITRLASQTFQISLSTSRLTEFIRSVSQTFNIALATARMAEFFRNVNQTIIATLNAARIGEWFRQASQTIGLNLQGIGEKITLYFRNVALTITTVFQTSRLAEWFRPASIHVGVGDVDGDLIVKVVVSVQVWSDSNQGLVPRLWPTKVLDIRVINLKYAYQFHSLELTRTVLISLNMTNAGNVGGDIVLN